MKHTVQQLEDRILSAFTLAYGSAQWEVADRLLLALEAIQPECLPDSSLARAYAMTAARNEEWCEPLVERDVTKIDDQ